MPYTITRWEDRPEFGGPKFYASLGSDYYRVSGINYSILAHDGKHDFHEVIVWKNDDEVAYRKGTSDALAVFHDYIDSLEVTRNG
jgi:hypothetical protein